MIQAPFNTSCAALQYNSGTKLSIEYFLSYTTLKIRKFQCDHVVFPYLLEVLVSLYQESALNDKGSAQAVDLSF